MPGFVKTKSDEKKWSKAKDAAAKQTDRGSEGFWKLSNYIFHKSEGNHEVAEFFKSELMKFGGMGQLSLKEKSPMHMGTHATSVKIPKQKHLPNENSKPSVFFKGENERSKQPSLQKLSDFIAQHKLKKCGV
jgi:hypothetical protein